MSWCVCNNSARRRHPQNWAENEQKGCWGRWVKEARSFGKEELRFYKYIIFCPVLFNHLKELMITRQKTSGVSRKAIVGLLSYLQYVTGVLFCEQVSPPYCERILSNGGRYEMYGRHGWNHVHIHAKSFCHIFCLLAAVFMMNAPIYVNHVLQTAMRMHSWWANHLSISHFHLIEIWLEEYSDRHQWYSYTSHSCADLFIEFYKYQLTHPMSGQRASIPLIVSTSFQ